MHFVDYVEFANDELIDFDSPDSRPTYRQLANGYSTQQPEKRS